MVTLPYVQPSCLVLIFYYLMKNHNPIVLFLAVQLAMLTDDINKKLFLEYQQGVDVGLRHHPAPGTAMVSNSSVFMA